MGAHLQLGRTSTRISFDEYHVQNGLKAEKCGAVRPRLGFDAILEVIENIEDVEDILTQVQAAVRQGEKF
jgi:hypothetical protein